MANIIDRDCVDLDNSSPVQVKIKILFAIEVNSLMLIDSFFTKQFVPLVVAKNFFLIYGPFKNATTNICKCVQQVNEVRIHECDCHTQVHQATPLTALYCLSKSSTTCTWPSLTATSKAVPVPTMSLPFIDTLFLVSTAFAITSVSAYDNVWCCSIIAQMSTRLKLAAIWR